MAASIQGKSIEDICDLLKNYDLLKDIAIIQSHEDVSKLLKFPNNHSKSLTFEETLNKVHPEESKGIEEIIKTYAINKHLLDQEDIKYLEKIIEQIGMKHHVDDDDYDDEELDPQERKELLKI